jgi:hypothetical protein
MNAEMVQIDRLEFDLLTSILDASPKINLHEPNLPPWASRDVYAHLARWMNYSNRNMPAYCAGKSVATPPDNSENLNAQWKQEDSSMTLRQAKQKAYEAFELRVHIIQSIPLNRWDKELKKIALHDGAEHFAAHRSYVHDQ